MRPSLLRVPLAALPLAALPLAALPLAALARAAPAGSAQPATPLPVRERGGGAGLAYSVAVSKRGTFSGWRFLARNVAYATDAAGAAEGIVRYATATAIAIR